MGRLISSLEPDVIRMCTAHIEACRLEGITLVVVLHPSEREGTGPGIRQGPPVGFIAG